MKLTPKSPQTPIRVSAPCGARSKRKAVAVGGVRSHFESMRGDHSPADLGQPLNCASFTRCTATWRGASRQSRTRPVEVADMGHDPPYRFYLLLSARLAEVSRTRLGRRS